MDFFASLSTSRGVRRTGIAAIKEFMYFTFLYSEDAASTFIQFSLSCHERTFIRNNVAGERICYILKII